MSAPPHPFVQCVELAVAPWHCVSAPAAQHLHSEHLAGRGAHEAPRQDAAGPALGDAPTLPTLKGTKRTWRADRLRGTSRSAKHLREKAGRPSPRLHAVPQLCKPPPGARQIKQLGNPHAGVSRDCLETTRPGTIGPYCSGRGEIAGFLWPFPTSGSAHHVAFLWALPGPLGLGPHRRDVNFQHPRPGTGSVASSSML